MTLIQCRPYSVLKDFQNEVSRLCNDAWPSNTKEDTHTTAWTPAVDIKEENDRFIVLADIPGVDPKTINIRMDENSVLAVSGEKITENKKEENGYTRLERFSGTFYRRFNLPDNVDAPKISAKSKHGVLEIIIPKREKSQPKSIEVKVEE